MAYTVSQNFKTAVKDETVKKSCLILFGDLFFDSTDITEEGVTIEQYFNTSEDLTYGDCPSDTLSFSVVSNGNLAGYGFGKARVFLGVQTATASYAFGDINAHIEVGGNIYTASSSGLYRNSTKIDNGVYVSLVSDGTTVYAVGTSSSVSVNNASGTVSAYTPNRFMAQKLQSGLSAVFSANTAYVWDGENVITYEYVPMGVYNVVKPRSTVGEVVTIQDAYDNMALFDRDAAEFINSLSFPRTLAQIYMALCNYVGVSYASSTFTYSTTSYSSSPFSDTQCTLRDILWWIAERARRVARFNRTGILELLPISTTVRETLTANDIGQDGYSVAEYATPAVTGVLLRGSSGNSLTFGTLDTAYVISANPFVSTISVSDLQAYMAIPTYVPMELTVLEADPSIDIGDFVSIKPMVEEYKVLTNVYNEIYVNANNEAYAVGSPTYSIPIMNRTVHFNGGIRATYTATGNEQREADLDNTEYNADVAANMAVDKSKSYADSVGQEVDESFTQQKVFNRLTDNGRAQGIFMDENGDIYFNATYINSGYISADRIQANSIAVSKLTGNITNGGWKIDLDNGTMTLGKLAVGSITGSLSTTSTTGNSWGIDFTNGTMNIGTLAVSKITGSKSLGNNWSINFDTGVMTIGTLNADNINGGTIKGSSINLGNGNFVVNGSTGAVTIKSGSIDIGSGKFNVTSAGALTSTSGLIGNWRIDSTRLYKTATTTAHTFDVVDIARMIGVINGQLDEATVLAQYPYYDLDGDGHITRFDVELCMDGILGVIPNGSISSSTTQLYPSKVYGSVSSIFDMANGIGFVAGAFGVWGTGLLGKALSLTDTIGSNSDNKTYLVPEQGLTMNFTPSYTDPIGNVWYTHFRGIRLSRSGIVLTLNNQNNTQISIQPKVVSTW